MTFNNDATSLVWEKRNKHSRIFPFNLEAKSQPDLTLGLLRNILLLSQENEISYQISN